MADLMTIYGVSKTTAKNWSRKGIIIPVVKIGNVVRFDLDDCARRLASASGLDRRTL